MVENETEPEKDIQETKDDSDKEVPAKVEDESTNEDAAKPSNKSGHFGRKEVSEPTPPTDDATKLDKELVVVGSPEEKEVFEEDPAKELTEDKDEDTAQMMEEEKEAGDAANDM